MVWHRVQPPWWDTAADVQEMHDFIADGEGYEGTDEYVPKGVDPYELKKGAARVAAVSGNPVLVRIDQWGAESKAFSAQVSRAETLRLRLLNYPAWSVEVNGRPVPTRIQPVTGELLFPISPGINRVYVRFLQTRDRLLGGCVSIVTLIIFVGVTFYLRRTRPRRTETRPRPA